MGTISFLRFFPYALDHKQTIAFSALSHLLESAFSQMSFQKKFMQKHSGKGDEELSVSERSEMLDSLWATVSTLYFIEKVCNSEPNMLSPVYEDSNLPIFARSAAELRNAKDHLAQRIGNYSKRKDFLPINGLVRWTFSPRVEAEEFIFNIQLFSVDPILKPFKIAAADDINGITRAFDHLTLYAFDGCLHVSRVHDALEGFIRILDENLAASIPQADSGGAPKKTDLSEAEQRPFCVVIEGRTTI
ncbi:hypothetical protein [Rhodosalinus sp. FB01]|uniref:hypothetical protein n=1 Tax=Rhodosalinus sp. FB01 TaxID=3239194 RepID=UPI0035266408